MKKQLYEYIGRREDLIYRDHILGIQRPFAIFLDQKLSQEPQHHM